MDLRVKRTRNSIINAFIELRSKKELEKITVKELAELACINKATFYQHYQDIYDLSESLEKEMLAAALNDIIHPETILETPGESVKEIARALLTRNSLLDIIFSGSRRTLLVDRLEKLLKEVIYANRPEYENDLKIDLLLTVVIQGNFRAFEEHRNEDPEQVMKILADLSEKITAGAGLDA